MARTAGLIFCHLFSQTISFVFSSVPFSSLSKRPDCATAQPGRDCVRYDSAASVAPERSTKIGHCKGGPDTCYVGDSFLRRRLEKRCPSYGGPRVRILLPPVGSQPRT